MRRVTTLIVLAWILAGGAAIARTQEQYKIGTVSCSKNSQCGTAQECGGNDVCVPMIGYEDAEYASQLPKWTGEDKRYIHGKHCVDGRGF